VSHFFWHEGHLGWTLFAILVFSMIGLLVLDLAWRTIIVRTVLMLPVALLIWMIGILAIIALAS
jgi:hypothetical protein